MDTLTQQSYLDLLQYAQHATRRADEAEDLLQTVLIAAIEADRCDLSCETNRRWLIGALRKRALFDARTAIRRRHRESVATRVEPEGTEPVGTPVHFLSSLPPALRTTALLILTGHTRTEIAWLLRLSDAALRRRIADIKRRWCATGERGFTEFSGLTGSLDFGQMRRALKKLVHRDHAILASHDPDGNLFVVSSQMHGSRQLIKGSDNREEKSSV